VFLGGAQKGVTSINPQGKQPEGERALEICSREILVVYGRSERTRKRLEELWRLHQKKTKKAHRGIIASSERGDHGQKRDVVLSYKKERSPS